MMASVKASEKYGVNWTVHSTLEGPNIFDRETTQIILLQEIRGELQRLNRLLHCSNFTDLPRTLRDIRTNTTKRKYVRKPKT